MQKGRSWERNVYYQVWYFNLFCLYWPHHCIRLHMTGNSVLERFKYAVRHRPKFFVLWMSESHLEKLVCWRWEKEINAQLIYIRNEMMQLLQILLKNIIWTILYGPYFDHSKKPGFTTMFTLNKTDLFNALGPLSFQLRYRRTRPKFTR